MENFDYIIVGAGSSGCVLANRLSEDPANRVLLIEAGGANQSPFIKMAGGFVKIMGKPEYFSFFPVSPMLGRASETHMYGRGLGGSSAINGTWYLRGMPRDFDGWRDMGLSDWCWDDIARAYAWMESYRAGGADPSRGTDGPLQITQSDYDSPVFRALIEACKGLGAPWLDDINTPGAHGVGRTQYTVDRRGQRASSYEAFVAPIRQRRNLTIVTDCTVTRLVIHEGRATGVAYVQAGQERTVDAGRDVIVSSGAYGSPKLLQLSGLGPGHALAALGIAVKRDLPAVGMNLRDHQMVTIAYDLHGDPGLNREYVGWRLYGNALRYLLTRKGPLARVGMPMTMLHSSEGDPTSPDFQLAAAPFAMRSSKEMKTEAGRGPISEKPGVTFSGFHLRPQSRGSVNITSSDPLAMPLVDAGWWSDARDQDKALQLLRTLRKMAASPALKAYVGAERTPGAEFRSDEQLIEELKWMMSPGLHGSGSCSMGLDPQDSVVDGRCRVHGVAGLRVVDCSIMPTPVSGNTNGPAMAIAVRAAELILGDARR